MSASAPARPELDGDLWRLAQATAGSRGFQFSSECAGEMKSLIQNGVIRLVQDQALDDATKIVDAKEAMTRLVTKMIELAINQQRGQIIKGGEATSTNMLHEYNFFGARSWFCPCYPFC